MATQAIVEGVGVCKLKEFLTDLLLDEIVLESLEALQRNRVSGKTFLELDDADLREMLPLIVERKTPLSGQLRASNSKRWIIRDNSLLTCLKFTSCHVKVQRTSDPVNTASAVRDSNWISRFKVPELFSTKTMQAIKNEKTSK